MAKKSKKVEKGRELKGDLQFLNVNRTRARFNMEGIPLVGSSLLDLDPMLLPADFDPARYDDVAGTVVMEITVNEK